MHRVCLLLGSVLSAGGLIAADGDVVFKSDVSLVRVDAQVLDRDNRALTGLRVEDFVLREGGRPQPIRNFATENMPVDVLLLLDVSGSMRPHVQRIADASHEALRVLRSEDRVAIMVFDRMTRVRMPFRNGRDEVEREFERLLKQEHFNGGTDITRAMLDAARYIGREGRKDARRAIVILTDDETEFDRDEAGVERALAQSNAVMSALIAPDAMGQRRGGMGRQGGTWPQGGGGGGGLGGPLGGIILGRPRYPGGGQSGGRYPGGRQGGPSYGGRTHSAGTSEIARESGGDSMPVDYASAFEDTLARIRQRYALYFYIPAGVRAGQERNIEVELANAASRRYPGAEVRFRRTYLAPADGAGGPAQPAQPEPVVVTRSGEPATGGSEDVPPRLQRRRAVNQVPDVDRAENPTMTSAEGGWRRAPADGQSADAAAEPTTVTPPAAAQPATPPPSQGGWRRVKPGEQPHQ